jgi:hypothetical protein
METSTRSTNIFLHRYSILAMFNILILSDRIRQYMRSIASRGRVSPALPFPLCRTLQSVGDVTVLKVPASDVRYVQSTCLKQSFGDAYRRPLLCKAAARRLPSRRTVACHCGAFASASACYARHTYLHHLRVWPLFFGVHCSRYCQRHYVDRHHQQCF